MNIQLLRELEAYIEQNRVEEPCLMQEQACFRPQLQIPHHIIDGSIRNKENKENFENVDKLEPDFSAFRRDKNEIETRGEASAEESAAFGLNEPSIQKCFSRSAPRASEAPKKPKEQDLEEYIKKQKSKETFSTKLLQYIDQTGLSDAEIYKRAGIDRRHFSKIRCDKDYQPKKATVLALCLALQLDEGKTAELLSLAGYSLSNGDTGDLVVKFCIERRIYDLMEVNAALDYFGQKAIGVVG